MRKSSAIVIGILIVFLILGNIEIDASPSSWKYVFPLKIENPNSYTLQDRPFRIIINTKYLVDAGYLKSDLSDLRFTSDLKPPDEGGSLIPYWVEPGTENTEETIIWIKPSQLQAGTNYIYLWCGNPSATSPTYTIPEFMGWKYRRYHIINSAEDADVNYTIKIILKWLGIEEEVIPDATIVSELPVPDGTSIICPQPGVYWDGNYLHVWFGSSTDGTDKNDDIYYTRSEYPFTNWIDPVKVIDEPSPIGVRSPISLVEGDYIYFFVQSFDGTNFRPIKLYKVKKDADFTNPNNYIFVGDILDVGASGSFDEKWVMSPAVVKINNTYYLTYEARDSANVCSIGIAKADSIEGPWTKIGQLKDYEGNVIYNPFGDYIAPDTWIDENTLVVHLYDGTAVRLYYIVGDVTNNAMKLSEYEIAPADGFKNHNSFAHVGWINGNYYFLLLSWNTSKILKMYKTTSRNDIISLDKKCREDFGDIRFTDSDGNTLLSYWFEEVTLYDRAIAWIRIPTNLTSSSATIYMYYGNSEATYQGSGYDVFPFFDDFDGTSIDTSRWSATGSVSVSNSELILVDTEEINGIVSLVNFSPPIIIEAKSKGTEPRRTYVSVSDGWPGFEHDNSVEAFVGGDNIWRLGTKSEGSGTLIEFGTPIEEYAIHSIYWNTSKVKYYVDGILKAECTTTIPTISLPIRFNDWGYDGGETRVDWVRVRKYIAEEPQHGEWGSEEIFFYDVDVISGNYFVILRWDNGTYIQSLSSPVTISYGGGSESTTSGFFIIDSDLVTSDYYTVQGSSFVRHYSTKFYTEAFIPEPDEEYTGVTIIINDYTGKFGGGWLKVYDSAQRLIQEEIIPLDYKVSCYLKLYETYKLVVETDNEERVLGYVTIDQENKTITSYIGTTPPTYSEILEGVNYNVTDTGTSIMVTVTSEEPIDVLIKIYNQTGEEFSHSSSNVETLSITHTYSEKTFRTVEITVTDPETGESKKVSYYVGTGVTQPFTLERTPNPLQLFNITFFSIPYEIRQLGLENLLVYCTGIVIFLILCTKYTLGVGCIGAGITILFMKAWIGNVTYPDLIASVVIVLGGLYEFTRRR